MENTIENAIKFFEENNHKLCGHSYNFYKNDSNNALKDFYENFYDHVLYKNEIGKILYEYSQYILNSKITGTNDMDNSEKNVRQYVKNNIPTEIKEAKIGEYGRVTTVSRKPVKHEKTGFITMMSYFLNKTGMKLMVEYANEIY